MLVKSLSHAPAVFIEYNGIKYMFTNDGKPVDIPPMALVSAYKSGHIHAHELIPVESEDILKLTEENKLLKEENLALKNEVKESERKVKKDGRKK